MRRSRTSYLFHCPLPPVGTDLFPAHPSPRLATSLPSRLAPASEPAWPLTRGGLRLHWLSSAFPWLSSCIPSGPRGRRLTFERRVSLGSSGRGPTVKFSVFSMTVIVLRMGQALLQAELQLGVCLLFSSGPLLLIFNKQNLLWVLVPSQAGPHPLPAGTCN